MSAQLRLVAAREIRERVRQRSFQISTVITLVLVLAVAAVPGLTGLGGSDPEQVAGADAAGRAVVSVAARTSGSEIRTSRVSSEAAGRKAVEDGDLDALVVGGRVVTKSGSADSLAALQAANARISAQRALARAGVSSAEQQQVLSPAPLRESELDPDQSDAGKGVFAFAVSLVLYMQILTVGLAVATGVVEEKASRVVEVLLATLRPVSLLGGKVLGLGVIGLGQVFLWTTAGLLAAGATGSIELDGSYVGAGLLAVAWFVLGFGFYAALYAVAGALVPRQEELQSSSAPLTTVMVIGYIVSIQALSNPDTILAKVCSFIPFTAPTTVPVRVALGAMSVPEVLVSVVIIVAATVAVVPIAARIYSQNVLRTGSRVGLKDALRRARAAQTA